MAVVLQILYAPRGVARIDKIAVAWLCRAVSVHVVLGYWCLVFTPICDVVLQQYLIVVVRALLITIYTIGDGHILLAVPLAEVGSETYTVEAAATETMLGFFALLCRYECLVILQNGR